MTFPYANMINRFPNLAPNSNSKHYRKFKADYEERAQILCKSNANTEEACLNAFLQILNENTNK